MQHERERCRLRTAKALALQHIIDLQHGLQQGIVILSTFEPWLHAVDDHLRKAVRHHCLADDCGLDVGEAVLDAEEQENTVVATRVADAPAIAKLLREDLRRLLLIAAHPVVQVHAIHQRGPHFEALLCAVRTLHAGVCPDRVHDIEDLHARTGGQDAVWVAKTPSLLQTARMLLLVGVRNRSQSPTLYCCCCVVCCATVLLKDHDSEQGTEGSLPVIRHLGKASSVKMVN
mmetsp:Transcript_79843/g.258728  ORF Transcript_79843/g.258728 Transcript_79843/m.258728 type:complete len:231 (-) Transcript_79843:27-719(-)